MFNIIRLHPNSTMTEARPNSIFLTGDNNNVTARVPNTGFLYLLVGIASSAFFLLLYGPQVLNPLNTGWLMEGGDLSQHYLGWLGFRSGHWQFPVGLTDALMYPERTSVIFTDSIALFAIPFKLVDTIVGLPPQFQYFGIWGIMCFVLQGLFACKIMLRFCRNKVYIFFASMLLVLSPVLIQRMFGHTSLAAHWEILMAIDAFFACKFDNRLHIRCLTWACIGCLCALTHIYLILITGIILAGASLYSLLRTKTLSQALTPLVAFIFSSGIMVFLAGGFDSYGSKAAEGGLGAYSMNLNSLINSCGNSLIVPGLPIVDDCQLEGFCYLGLGTISLIAIAVTFMIITSSATMETVKRNKSLIASMLLTCFAACVFALSPTITLGAEIVLKYPIPSVAEKVWSVFRATGRVSWVLFYFVTVSACLVVARIPKQSALIAIGGIVVAIQLIDLSPYYRSTFDRFHNAEPYITLEESDSSWSIIRQDRDWSCLVMVPTIYHLESNYSVAEWALDARIYLNSFTMAHPENHAEMTAYTSQSLENPSPSQLFISSTLDPLSNDKLTCYKIGKYYVACVGGLSEFEPIGSV